MYLEVFEVVCKPCTHLRAGLFPVGVGLDALFKLGAITNCLADIEDRMLEVTVLPYLLFILNLPAFNYTVDRYSWRLTRGFWERGFFSQSISQCLRVQVCCLTAGLSRDTSIALEVSVLARVTASSSLLDIFQLSGTRGIGWIYARACDIWHVFYLVWR